MPDIPKLLNPKLNLVQEIKRRVELACKTSTVERGYKAEFWSMEFNSKALALEFGSLFSGNEISYEERKESRLKSLEPIKEIEIHPTRLNKAREMYKKIYDKEKLENFVTEYAVNLPLMKYTIVLSNMVPGKMSQNVESFKIKLKNTLLKSGVIETLKKITRIEKSKQNLPEGKKLRPSEIRELDKMEESTFNQDIDFLCETIIKMTFNHFINQINKENLEKSNKIKSLTE